MNNELLLNSFHVIKQNWRLILAILVCVTWGSLLIFAILKNLKTQQFTDNEMTALALSGWPIPLLLISASIIFLKAFIPQAPVVIFSLILITISTIFALRSIWNKASPAILPIIFLLFVFVRIGFVADMILPPYFDSAEHYRIIQSLLSTSTKFPATTYYHIGYHVIISAFTWITRQNLSQVMLLFGQVILAAIPLPAYFFIKRITGSQISALFGVTLAAFAWFMPAHAVNWGKYPALLSLLTIQFTLAMALIKNRWLFALSLITSVLIHSRSPILICVVLGAWVFSIIWNRQTQNKRIVLLGLTGFLLGSTILLIKQNQILGPILEPYLVWSTLLIGLLAVCAFRSFPQLIFFSMFAILSILAGMFVPITSTITLLDRPLVEMILFLPLTFLGGISSIRIPKFIIPIMGIAVIAHAWMTYSFSPSGCCQLAGRDDAVVLDWADKHLPVDANIAIASADLSLNSFGEPLQSTGTDAGIWITPLAQRTTTHLPYTTDFTSSHTHALICDKRITYVYIGARPQSFDPELFLKKPDWYEYILFLPNAKIIRVLGCNPA